MKLQLMQICQGDLLLYQCPSSLNQMAKPGQFVVLVDIETKLEFSHIISNVSEELFIYFYHFNNNLHVAPCIFGTKVLVCKL